MMLQLDHERHLKLDAFERVEDLQRQVGLYKRCFGGTSLRGISRNFSEQTWPISLYLWDLFSYFVVSNNYKRCSLMVKICCFFIVLVVSFL